MLNVNKTVFVYYWEKLHRVALNGRIVQGQGLIPVRGWEVLLGSMSVLFQRKTSVASGQSPASNKLTATHVHSSTYTVHADTNWTITVQLFNHWGAGRGVASSLFVHMHVMKHSRVTQASVGD